MTPTAADVIYKEENGNKVLTGLAVAEPGYAIQIDYRGIDPQTGMAGSSRHRTGAIYRRAPARARASRPPGEWNTFEIEAAGPRLHVCLSGVLISSLIADGEARGGYIGLQAHDPGSRVRFRNLQIQPR